MEELRNIIESRKYIDYSAQIRTGGIVSFKKVEGNLVFKRRDKDRFIDVTETVTITTRELLGSWKVVDGKLDWILETMCSLSATMDSDFINEVYRIIRKLSVKEKEVLK